MQLLPRGSRRSSAVPAALIALATLCSCSTDAEGVNECRDVEYARCEASVACEIIEQDEVEACRRFYRDHCLHGISGNQLPSAEEHRECLDLIEEAGEQASAAMTMGGAGATDEACSVIAAPWESKACEYLVAKSSMGGAE